MIDHEGIIDRIEGDKAHVKINSVTACASCNAKGVCSAADMEEKHLDINLHGAVFNSGESVRVEVTTHLGLKAVALGYFYPFLLLMTVLFILIFSGTEELTAGIFALLSVVPYYLVLYLFRKRIESTFTFRIKKSIPE